MRLARVVPGGSFTTEQSWRRTDAHKNGGAVGLSCEQEAHYPEVPGSPLRSSPKPILKQQWSEGCSLLHRIDLN
jgi:hypothetical protein